MSSILETKAVEYTDQDDFLNCIIHIETDMEPEVLLKTLMSIEDSLGRERIIPKGPRIIDLDILLYEEEIIRTEVLNIPHPAIKQRWFILKHLVELDPELCDPETEEQYILGSLFTQVMINAVDLALFEDRMNGLVERPR